MPRLPPHPLHPLCFAVMFCQLSASCLQQLSNSKPRTVNRSASPALTSPNRLVLLLSKLIWTLGLLPLGEDQSDTVQIGNGTICVVVQIWKFGLVKPCRPGAMTALVHHVSSSCLCSDHFNRRRCLSFASSWYGSPNSLATRAFISHVLPAWTPQERGPRGPCCRVLTTSKMYVPRWDTAMILVCSCAE